MILSAELAVTSPPTLPEPLPQNPSLSSRFSNLLWGTRPAGLIETYTVNYLGGHPAYPKAKSSWIQFRMFQDRFRLALPGFWPNSDARFGWFKTMSIPYERVVDVQIVKGQLTSFQGFFGELMRLSQFNNIHIAYESEDGQVLKLRLAMISGLTVWGAAAKCQEFEDRLNIHQIRKLFRTVPSTEAEVQAPSLNVPAQLEQLAALRDKRIISDQEFQTKKAELLSRM